MEGQRKNSGHMLFSPRYKNINAKAALEHVPHSGTGVQRADCICLPVLPWSALACLVSSGTVRQRDRLPHHQALLLGSLRGQGLSAH